MSRTDTSRSPAPPRAPLALLVPAGLAALLTIVPIGYLFDRSLAAGPAAILHEIWLPRTLSLIGRSFALVGVVTLSCALLGTLLALLVTRTNLPMRRSLAVILALPLAVPSYISAFVWVSAMPDIAGFWGASLVLTLSSFPYVMLPVTAALLRADPAQEEVARSLGKGNLAVLLRVTLRQARASIAAGSLLVALYVLSDFGAVGAMRYEAFTWVIYGAYRNGFNPSRAAILSVVLLIFAMVLVLAEARARGRAAAARMGGGVPRPAMTLRLGRYKAPALGLVAAVIGAALVFPAFQILQWIQRAVAVNLDFAEFGRSLTASLLYSASAAIVATILAIPVGVMAARYRGRLPQTVERITYVAHGLPGIVIAISTVYIGVRLLRPIYQEAELLVLAYVVLFLPLAVGSVRAAVEGVPGRLEEVAGSLGRGRLSSFLSVTGRLAAPGIAAGTALVFLATMKELPATLLLHPTGTDTLATSLWKYTTSADYGPAAPYAAALVLFAAVPAAILGVWTSRQSGAKP